MTRRILLPLALLLVAPAAAAAQGTATTPAPVTTTPAATTPAATTPAATPKPKPKPKVTKPVVTQKKGAITVRLEKVGKGTIITGQRFRVRGAVRPYVAGQKVVVRFYRGGRKIKASSVALQPAGKGTFGRFLVGYTTRKSGTITVRVSHRATPQLGTIVTKGRSVRVLDPRASLGSRGPVVRLLQSQLADLGYVVGQRGYFDARTSRAVLAFRKVTRMARTSSATPDVFRALAAGKGAFKVRYPKHGKHIEGDLTHQVIALIGKNGKVERIYPTSSGKPSTPTILGSFRVYRKQPGTNSHGMVFSDYFIRGYAIHGYAQVPVYPASHGCLRVPVPDAVPIYNWISYGDRVDVYYR